jgi:hypothetical protein
MIVGPRFADLRNQAERRTFDLKDWIIALISGLLGTAIGAIGTAGATYYFTKKHTYESERKQALNLAKALSIELSTIVDRYMAIAGNEIERTGRDARKPPLIGIFESAQDYFTIYNNSSNLISLFDEKTAEQIIKTYTHMKGFLDELIYFGKLSKRVEEADIYSGAREGESGTIHVLMENYFPYLYDRNFEVKRSIEETIAMLNDFSIRRAAR